MIFSTNRRPGLEADDAVSNINPYMTVDSYGHERPTRTPLLDKYIRIIGFQQVDSKLRLPCVQKLPLLCSRFSSC